MSASSNSDSPPPGPAPDEGEGSDYRDFPLKKVTWGYREQFRRLIDELYAEGVFADGSRSPAELCRPFLGKLPRAGYDYVLKQFLAALNGSAGALLRSPRLFRRWRALGAELAEETVYLGKRYFELWRAGDLPLEPQEVDRMLDWARELKETDPELAFSFLAGYPSVRERVALEEMPQFIQNGLEVHDRNPSAARRFFRMELRSSEAYAERLSRVCRLETMRGRLRRLFRAVSGREVELEPLHHLDSDDLIERKCSTVCGGGHLYLPARISVFESESLNRGFYLLSTLLSAACHRFRSFPVVHGSQGVQRASDLFSRLGDPAPRRSGFLLQVVELCRLRRCIARHYPGAVGLLEQVARAESRLSRPETTAEELLALALGTVGPGEVGRPARELFEWVAGTAERCSDHVCALENVQEAPRSPIDPRTLLAPPVSFFPDFDFPLQVTRAPEEAVVSDLSSQAEPGAREAESVTPSAARGQESAEEDGDASGTGRSGGEEDEEAEEGGTVPAAFFYDEWNGLEGEYYRDWCALREVMPPARGPATPQGEQFQRRVESVKKLFQRLRPDLVEKEKYLPQGDYIDIDSLVRFVTRRRARLSPRVDFWIRPRVSVRDMATALLVDVSGSTGKETGSHDIIEIEKEAAYTLACGLEEIGDRFGVFGFTGNGRQDCRFLVYKDIDEDWSQEPKERLMGARPGASTRIGVALRHAGRKLAETESRTRLIIVLTDGRPMDTGYDPETHYAQRDVHKACEENHALGVHTFCIGTDPEAAEELELQFPAGRWVVLKRTEDLPRTLARSYLQLTRD